MLDKLLTALLSNPIGLLTAASPFLLNYYNASQEELARQRDIRESTQKGASAIAFEIAKNADLLTYYNKQAVYAIVFRGLSICTENPDLPFCGEENTSVIPVSDTDTSNFQKSREQFLAWNTNVIARHAQVARFFGGDEASRMFESILRQIYLLECMTDAAYFRRLDSRFFIEDNDDDGKGSKRYLIDLLEIDPEECPRLHALLSAEPDEANKNPNDFRNKYTPIFTNLITELTDFGRLMFSNIESVQLVGSA